jgi:hypothetical protein
MKITISIGEDAKRAFEVAIEEGVVTGLSIDGYSLTFDYEGLDPNAALQRAVSNATALQNKALELAEAGDPASQLFSYAQGYMATATAALATEQAQQMNAASGAPIPSPALGSLDSELINTPTEPNGDNGKDDPLVDAEKPRSRRRSQEADETVS